MDICYDAYPDAGVRTFSFASSPTEPDLVITYKEGYSESKRLLKALIPGDKVRVVQYGNSGFMINKKHPVTLIAGGVGIAPLRSMLKELIDTQSQIDTTIIYQAHTDDFPFKDELDQWTEEYSFLQVHYLDSSLKGRVKKEAILKLSPISSGSMYYIAGPPGMVETVENFLLGSDINPKYIHDDSFTGY